MAENIKSKAIDKPLGQFLDDLASAKSSPGGGSAACLQGSIGAGLIAMVCALTKKCDTKSQYFELNKDVFKKATKIKDEFASLVDNDIAEVQNFFRNIMTLPNNTEDEKAYKKSKLQETYKKLADPPSKCIELCYKATKLLVDVYGKSYSYAQSDLGCAAFNINSASECAWINVVTNFKFITDDDYINDLTDHLAQKLDFIKRECIRIYNIEQNYLY